TTGAPAPACTSNLLPANNAVLATPNSANLSWTASATATSYDVYIWTGAIVPTTPVANVPLTGYAASGLTAGVTYNWYVSPRNASGPAVGCVSNKTVFVTAAAPVPACAVNLLPANGSTLTTASTATLTWNPVLNASSYDVFIWTGATPPATPVANVSGTSYAAAGLTLGSLYNWYMVPKNAAGSASGCNSTSSFSFTTASDADGTGLQGVYYNGTAFAGTPLLTRIDPTINFELTYSTVLTPAPGVVPPDNYSVRWTGQVKPLYSETYTFYTVSDDGIRLWVNGVQLVNNFVNQGATEKSGSITLVAGQKYDIVIEYYEATGEAVTKLYWSSPSTPKAIVPQSQLYPPAAAPAARIAAASSTDTATSSPLASVAAQPTISSTVSPNPVSAGQQARLQINSDKPGNAYISIVNSMGFVVNTRQVSLATGSNTVTINTSSLSLGLYIINISGGTTPVNLKLLVE
ncbi:MAG TPA: PA14 domain-containing protein, partial [Chitinophagaceae bacterium]|nr:PA14 domain-containing protein [Chitinophagaceae bacterium]